MKLSKQEQRIYNLLLERPRTARELILEGGTNYPSSKIIDLKAKGIKIETKSIPNKNYGYYEIAQ